MEDYNRSAARRAKEARADEMSKPMGKVKPKSRPGTVRPQARPEIVDLTPEAERYEDETRQEFRDGGVAKARGMKMCQMSGRNGGKTY